MQRAAILVMLMYFLKANIPNLVENGPVLSYKSKFQFSYVNDLHYLNRFQVTGCNSSEKSKVFTFFYRKTLVTKFDLVIK